MQHTARLVRGTAVQLAPLSDRSIPIYKTLIIGWFIAALALTTATAAATSCSIHPDKNATDAQLLGLAKVSQADAERSALARVKSPATVVGAELQSEHGCLVWSLVLKVTGSSGIRQMQVDAGTGKVLAAKHGSAQQESAAAKKP